MRLIKIILFLTDKKLIKSDHSTMHETMRVFPVKRVLSKQLRFLILVDGAVDMCAHAVRR